jgi:hypothetical protein
MQNRPVQSPRERRAEGEDDPEHSSFQFSVFSFQFVERELSASAESDQMITEN